MKGDTSMEKLFGLFKMIFSRIFLVALSVIIQVVLLVYFAFELTGDFVYFQALSTILGILVFVIVVNRKLHPEHKLMWAFLIMAVPIVGITLYIVLDASKPSKRRMKKYTSFDTSLIAKDDNYKKEVYSIANKYEGQIKYLEKNSLLNCYKNTECNFYPNGLSFYEALLEDLRQAKKFIFMEYFIIRPGKMWDSILEVLEQKVKEGVEVRFLYDDVGSCNYVRGWYYKKLKKLGINCAKFNTMIPMVSSYHNNRDHRKITVIDGKIGYTGGINIGDEYLNITSPYGYWKDNAVRIKGEATNNLTILFLQNFSLATLNKKTDFAPYLYKEKEVINNNQLVFAYGTGPKVLYHENMAIDVFLNLINQAQKYIDISTPYLIIDYSLRNALISAAARGVRVRILFPSKPDKKLIYAFGKQYALELIEHGVEVYSYTPGFNHAKSILIDDEVAYIGTTNLDFRSLLHHYECGVWLYNCDCIKDIDENFEKDYLCSKKLSAKDIKTSLFTKILISFLKIFSPLL